MKITLEISALVEKIDTFRNLIHVLILWICSGVNNVSVKGLEGSARKSLFFDIFTRIFAYFPHFMLFTYVEQIKICLLS